MELHLNEKLKDVLEDKDRINYPKDTISAYAKQIEEQTDEIIQIQINEYSGPIESYTSNPLFNVVQRLGISVEHNIQEELGNLGGHNYKFEFLIHGKDLPYYEYRLFFIGYEIGGYPCDIVLEKGFSDDLNQKMNNEGFVYRIDNNSELEIFLNALLGGEKFIELLKQIIIASKYASLNGGNNEE